MRVDDVQKGLDPGELLITASMPIGRKYRVYVDGVEQKNVIGVIHDGCFK